MPINLSTISPKIAKSNKMADAMMTDLLAIRRRSLFDNSWVKEKKIGVNPVIVKSGELKSVPNPLEKINQNQIQYVEKIISLMQKEFLNILKDTRDISSEVIDLVSDGRILTGGQAKSMNLIDEIGSERDAIFWLKQRGNLEDDIPVVDISSKDDFLNILNIKSFKNNVNLKFLNGILAILSN